MRLALVDCKQKEGGYRHSVFERHNGKPTMVYTVKFSDILSPNQVALFRLGPEVFVQSLE